MHRKLKKHGQFLHGTLRRLLHPHESNNFRPRLLHPEWMLALSVLAFVAVFSLGLLNKSAGVRGGVILGYATNITVDQVVAQTNQQRAAVGLQPLAYSGVLSAAAQSKADDMFSNNYWAHVSPSGKQPWDFIHEAGYSYSAAGENLARDFYETGTMMGAWMASPTHKANIVNSKYTQIGVAVVNGTLQGTETTLVVQMFGNPLGAGVPVGRTGDASVAPTPTVQPVPMVLATPVPAVAGESEPAVRDTPLPTPVPTTAPTHTPIAPQALQMTQAIGTAPGSDNQILAAFSFIMGEIRPWPAISPAQFVKALGVVIIGVLAAVLLYDWTLVRVNPRSRLVGHNMAHILYLATIALLIATFHSGLIQ